MAMIFYDTKGRNKFETTFKSEKRDITKSPSLVVLSAIYAIVAGLAITEALGAYIGALDHLQVKSPIDLVTFLTTNLTTTTSY